MLNKLILLLTLLNLPLISFANPTTLNGDLDGDGKNEKIVLEEYKDRDWTFKLSIYKNNKLVFTYNKFDNKPLDNAKIINFKIKGTGKSRDVLFIIVAECSAEFHVVSYEKVTNEEGGNAQTKYIVKKYVGKLQSCY